MSENRFCVLKKILTKTNTLSTRICSDTDLGNRNTASRLHVREEHWNKSSYKSQCIYKLRSSAGNNIYSQNIDEMLYIQDMVEDPNEVASINFNAIAEVLSSLEHSEISDKIVEVPVCADLDDVESFKDQYKQPGVPIDTERFLDDWAKDIAQASKIQNAVCSLPTKINGVLAGVTHINVNGLLKFYSEVKEYGFIVTMDEIEVFVHKADLVKQGIDTRSLAYYRKFYNIAVRFDIEEYQGKTDKHRKAINMIILSITPICP